MNKHAYSPEGLRIVGTVDLCPCCALGDVQKDENGSIDIEFSGESKMYWDGQYQDKDLNDEDLYQCEKGEEWPESSLIWSFEDTDQLLPETEEEIHEQAHT